MPPFAGSDTTAVLRLVVHEPAASPRSLVAGTPRPLEAVCLKALAKKPAERYAKRQGTGRRVKHFLADEPVKACREPLSVRLGRWMKRHRTLVTGATAAVLWALIGLDGNAHSNSSSAPASMSGQRLASQVPSTARSAPLLSDRALLRGALRWDTPATQGRSRQSVPPVGCPFARDRRAPAGDQFDICDGGVVGDCTGEVVVRPRAAHRPDGGSSAVVLDRSGSRFRHGPRSCERRCGSGRGIARSASAKCSPFSAKDIDVLRHTRLGQHMR